MTFTHLRSLVEPHLKLGNEKLWRGFDLSCGAIAINLSTEKEKESCVGNDYCVFMLMGSKRRRKNFGGDGGGV